MVEKHKYLITDLDEIFFDWARHLYETNERRSVEKRLDAKLPWEKLRKNIDYSKFVIDTEEMKYATPGLDVSPKGGNHVVFKTTYANTTNSEMEYNLNTQRTTRNTTSMRLTKGITQSGHVGLKLKLPGDIAELEGGYSREVMMEKGIEKTQEEEMTWSANTVIKVPPKTNTTVSLVIQETEYNGDFRARATFHGKVLIIIYHDDLELCRFSVKNFKEMLNESVGFSYDPQNGCVSFDVIGKCYCRFGMEQKIEIIETPI